MINKYQIRLYDSTVLTIAGNMNIAIARYVPSYSHTYSILYLGYKMSGMDLKVAI